MHFKHSFLECGDLSRIFNKPGTESDSFRPVNKTALTLAVVYFGVRWTQGVHRTPNYVGNTERRYFWFSV